MKKNERPFSDSIFLNEIISVLTDNGTLCEEIEDACLIPKGYLQHLIHHPDEVRLTDVALIAAVRRCDVFFNVFGGEPVSDQAHPVGNSVNKSK